MKAVHWAVRSLKFAPNLEALADQICNKILAHSPKGFDGVHLRIEGDAMHAGFVASLAGNNSMKVVRPPGAVLAFLTLVKINTAMVCVQYLLCQLTATNRH